MQGKQEQRRRRPQDKSRRGTGGTTKQASRTGCHNSDLVESLMFFLYGYLTWSTSTKTPRRCALIWSRRGHTEPFMILNRSSKQKRFFSSGPHVWAEAPLGQSAQDADKTAGKLNQYLQSLLYFLLIFSLPFHLSTSLPPSLQTSSTGNDTGLTLLLTSFSLGRMSKVKPSACPRERLPPFMKLPKASTSPSTCSTDWLACRVWVHAVHRGDRRSESRHLYLSPCECHDVSRSLSAFTVKEKLEVYTRSQKFGRRTVSALS